MADNILKTLNKNNQSILQFNTSVALTLDNTLNDQLIKSISIDVTDPQNMNTRSALVENKIPFVQINNTIDMVEKFNMFPDETLPSNTTEQYQKILKKKQIQASFESNIIQRTKTQLSSIVNDTDLVIKIKKPTGFYSAIKETINRKGTFKIYDDSNKLIYTEYDILHNLYNSSIANYILSKDAVNATGLHKINIESLKYGNNIPIEINGKTFNTAPSFNLNYFIIRINISNKNNILHKILTLSDKSKKFSTSNSVYNINFRIFFDIEIVDKFPIEFLLADSVSSYSANNKLLTQQSRHSIIINGIPKSSTFESDCLNGKYKNLYLVFI